MKFIRYYCWFITILFCVQSKAQKVELQGSVYDYSNRLPIEAVSVLCSCGGGTTTDSNGHYIIFISQQDSIWFSYLGKNTVKYPVDTISNPNEFIVGLHIDIKWLPEVKVQNHNYKLDSIQNRKDYAKIFDYKKPGLKVAENYNSLSNYIPGSVTVGLDLDELINMFRFRRNRQMLSFQNRLLKEEQDKYIDHRFSVRLIKQLTNIDTSEFSTFMTAYRPQYDILQQMNDLEVGYYVQLCYKDFMQNKRKYRNGRTILGAE